MQERHQGTLSVSQLGQELKVTGATVAGIVFPAGLLILSYFGRLDLSLGTGAKTIAINQVHCAYSGMC